ncbi:RDD family protein [uncultured archaeon]|nr:RDD family protein [uncultured archaeon]
MSKAPIGKRIIAYIIDSIVMMILGFGLMAVAFVINMTLLVATDSTLLQLLSMLLYFLAVIPMILFMFLRDGLFGGTGVGKKLMGLKVVSDGGKPAGFKESILRNITWCIPILNWAELILPFVDKDGKRIGDKIAKTQVTEK